MRIICRCIRRRQACTQTYGEERNWLQPELTSACKHKDRKQLPEQSTVVNTYYCQINHTYGSNVCNHRMTPITFRYIYNWEEPGVRAIELSYANVASVLRYLDKPNLATMNIQLHARLEIDLEIQWRCNFPFLEKLDIRVTTNWCKCILEGTWTRKINLRKFKAKTRGLTFQELQFQLEQLNQTLEFAYNIHLLSQYPPHPLDDENYLRVLGTKIDYT